MARPVLYLWHNKNKKLQETNKNNTYRLQHKKNNNAEPQLTDSFGEEPLLRLAP
ncbi:hypothetical protein SAMN05216296_0596 [Pseudomonas pohangensis]|jgi:hypothetical protein|uniref:Uncharacterized protein n=1 Tax=Pseudomonas pohangensis TaxID=364197 RepID=A0A1H2EAW4_9PSED|nr:hypothetical protein [Pseudomonas pohangensis]SDT92247.1 hypothetical protein SAMN05216296_0596 [Pseudomonas pohangensis]